MNSSDRILAQRYAKAYDALATSNQQAQARAEELAAASQALAGAQAFMTDPNVSVPAKTGFLREALMSAPAAQAFLNTLVQAKRYNLLGQIVREVNALLDARLGIIRAEISSAVPLTDALKAHAESVLSARYGGKVAAVYHTDPALIGGVKILCRGELIDASLKRQFEKMQEELTK